MGNTLKSIKAEAAKLEQALIALGGDAYQFETKLTRPGVKSIIGFKDAPRIELVQNVLGYRPSPALADVVTQLGYTVRVIPRKGTVGAAHSTLFLKGDIALSVMAFPAKAEVGKFAVILRLTPHTVAA